mgnify:CR=1 FL=1
MKKKLILSILIIFSALVGLNYLHIKSDEISLATSSGEASVVLFRKPFSSYSNRIEIETSGDVYRKDFKGKNPFNIWKLEVGDMEGDGEMELALGVYKKSPHHKVMAKRVFLYNIVDGSLKPKFRASRLSLPMDDFILYDIDGDGRDEIVSIEIKDKSYFIAAYHYENFHLPRDYVSKPLVMKPSFAGDGKVMYDGRTFNLNIREKEIELK